MHMFDKVKNYFKPKPLTKEQSFTWKNMDLEPGLVEELQQIYSKELTRDLDTYNFFQWLSIDIPKVNGLKVHRAALIYSAGKETPIFSHKDPIPADRNYPDKRDWGPIVLNIPLLNCETSITKMYKDPKEPIHYMTIYNEPAEILPIRDAELLTSYVLDRPVLFNTQVLHAVFNQSDKPRFAVSLRFKESPLEWI